MECRSVERTPTRRRSTDRLGAPVLAALALTACDDYVKGVRVVVRPRVLSTIPAADAAGVDVEQPIVVTFSETIDPASVDESSFLVRSGETPVPGTVVSSGAVLTFTPDPRFSLYDEISVTLTLDLLDRTGDSMKATKAAKAPAPHGYSAISLVKRLA